MKLVEVVFLIGSHCVSPIEHTTPLTEVHKVQCAVVVERDTGTNSVVVTPATAAGNPLVVAAVERLMATGSPASGPALQQEDLNASVTAPEVSERRAALSDFRARPEVIGTNLIQEPPAEVEEDQDMPPSTEVAEVDEEPPPQKLKPKPRATKKAKKSKARARRGGSQCGAGRQAVWYTNKDGRRKYRCRRSSGPQLY